MLIFLIMTSLPSQHFDLGSTLFQRCGSNVEIKLMLHNVNTKSVPDVETTSKQRCTTLIQYYINVFATYFGRQLNWSYKYGIYGNTHRQCHWQWWHTRKLEILHLKLKNFSEKFENIKSAYFIPWRKHS